MRKKSVWIPALVASLVFVTAPLWITHAQESADQVLLNLSFLKNGVSAQGARVLQVGTIGTTSAAVASATRTEVVAAPASGSIVLLGIQLEKATATTGSVTVTQGTGTNCGTGPVVVITLGPQTASSLLPIGYYPVNNALPAGKALCLTTDAATTSARALTQ